MITPKFITFTGIDQYTNMADAEQLAQDYPVEFGVLFSPKRQGVGYRYPGHSWLESIGKFWTPPRLKLSAHLCGDDARMVLQHQVFGRNAGDHFPEIKFERMQLNGRIEDGFSLMAINEFARKLDVQVILQHHTEDVVPNSMSNLMWLYDKSGGNGRRPAQWPHAVGSDLVGYAGGINPDNVADVVSILSERATNYWIDMESGVRDDLDWFDLKKCRAVCEAVYG